MSFAKNVWDTLAAVDVSEKINKKGKMSYLSWAWAWAQLMKYYPESTYDFKPVVIDAAGTVEVWCDVTVRETIGTVDNPHSGTITCIERTLTRSMWLPVMDFKNASVINPTSREVSDNRMRCLVKCIAMFGLGHYIYAGEDLPDPEVSEAADKAKYDALCSTLTATIDTIKESIESGDFSAGSEAWQELSEDEKMGLWKATSKGGCFTTQERETMKSPEFRKANQ